MCIRDRRATCNPVHRLQENSSSCFNPIHAFQMMKNENSSPTLLPTPSFQNIAEHLFCSRETNIETGWGGGWGESGINSILSCVFITQLFFVQDFRLQVGKYKRARDLGANNFSTRVHFLNYMILRRNSTHLAVQRRMNELTFHLRVTWQHNQPQVLLRNCQDPRSTETEVFYRAIFAAPHSKQLKRKTKHSSVSHHVIFINNS